MNVMKQVLEITMHFATSDIADNTIGPVDQSNNADGSGDADFTQNNNIPTINQVLVAENDCDQIR